MKVIGVLGGIGPQATIDFEERVHAAAQRWIPPLANSGYPPMVVYYYRFPPVIVGKDGKAATPIRPDPRFLDAAKQLGSLADFLVITANAAHILQPEIEQASGRKVLSMIEVALAEVRRRRWTRVGVLGLGDPVVYVRPLKQLEVEPVALGEDLRDRLDRAIFLLMEGRHGPAEEAVAVEAVEALRGRDTDGIILGCTEIPLLLREAAEAPDLINPAQLLAAAAVRFSMEP